MEESKRAILQRLRQALQCPTSLPYPDAVADGLWADKEDYWEILFAEHFKAQGGTFFYCEDAVAMVEILGDLCQKRGWSAVHCWDATLLDMFELGGLDTIHPTYPDSHEAVGITTCQGLLARTGSVLMSNQQTGGRILSLLPSVHIVIATIRQLFYDLQDALEQLKQRLPAMLTVITGPSRTADIEKTLVLGAHAPKELFVFLLEN